MRKKNGSSKLASSGVWLCLTRRKTCWSSSTRTYMSICQNFKWIMSPPSREQATYLGWRWPHWLVKYTRSKLGLPWSGRCWDLQKMHLSWLRHDHENVLSCLAGERPEKIWEELWERYWFTSWDPPLIQPGSAKQTEQPQFKNADFSPHLYFLLSSKILSQGGSRVQMLPIEILNKTNDARRDEEQQIPGTKLKTSSWQSFHQGFYFPLHTQVISCSWLLILDIPPPASDGTSTRMTARFAL